MPGTILSPLYARIHLILTIQKDRNCHDVHISGEEVEAQKTK